MQVQSRGGSGDSGCARGPPSPPPNKPCKPICLIIIEYSYIKLLDTFTLHNITDPRLPSKQRPETCRTRSRSHLKHEIGATHTFPQKSPIQIKTKKETPIKHSLEGRIVSQIPFKECRGVLIIHASSTQNNAVPTPSNPEPSNDLTTKEVQQRRTTVPLACGALNPDLPNQEGRRKVSKAVHGETAPYMEDFGKETEKQE